MTFKRAIQLMNASLKHYFLAWMAVSIVIHCRMTVSKVNHCRMTVSKINQHFSLSIVGSSIGLKRNAPVGFVAYLLAT